MSTKKIIIITSAATIITGALVWFFILRKGNGISQEDRTSLQQLTIEEGTLNDIDSSSGSEEAAAS